MISLALSTSFGKFSCAVYADGEKVASKPGQSLYGADVAATINGLLAGAGRTLADIDRFLLDVGPGGTSSVRTGVAFVNALSYGLDVPVYAVTSAEIICREVAGEAAATDRVVALANSLGETFYYGTAAPDQFEVKLGTAADLQTLTEGHTGLVLCGDPKVAAMITKQADAFNVPVRIATVSTVNLDVLHSLVEAGEVKAVKFPELPIPVAETLG